MRGTNVYYISGQTNAAGNIVPIWTLIGILYGGYILGQSDIVFFFLFSFDFYNYCTCITPPLKERKWHVSSPEVRMENQLGRSDRMTKEEETFFWTFIFTCL